VDGSRDAVGRNASKRESALGGTPVAPLPDAHIVAIPGGAARDRAGDGGCAGTERVTAGDTLWDIGRALIHSKDDGAIAAYVQRLHQLNRDVIGDDPDLILPGQRLQLPDCER
jgi:nucleoid-associated protein YgaU